MNLLLLHPGELAPDGTAVLTDRRLAHAREVLRVVEGDTLRVGVKHGRIGTGRIRSSTPEALTLECTLTDDPPPRPGIDLIIAIPRPKALRRVIPAIASLGVDRVVLLNAAKVEKSYFDAKVLSAEALDALVDLGLEQAKDTVPPRIEVRTRFRPFVEDEVGTFFPQDALRLVPDPGATEAARAMPTDRRLVIAIGPDGGWTPFEVDLLARAGFMPIQLGPRVLRGEVAVPAVISALRPGLVLAVGGADETSAR
ncbi:MAG: 16S rRNA (uracil(1498)-N(3))-methyltransferase [Myxococcaceae bacterium]|jgi:RsmE family RNA methyltransferase|nr:16S rRNA (uracil(1498)-N(3))-methyltransferase [Myxococcaceae bacterium]